MTESLHLHQVHVGNQPFRMQIFVSGPLIISEIYGKDFIDMAGGLNVLPTAERLASEAKSLFDLLNTVRSWKPLDPFPFELRKIDTQDEQCTRYKMLLRIDPLLWFRCYELHNAETLVNLLIK